MKTCDTCVYLDGGLCRNDAGGKCAAKGYDAHRYKDLHAAVSDAMDIAAGGFAIEGTRGEGYKITELRAR